jgi:hypothetical protein
MATDLWRYRHLYHRTDDPATAKASGAPRPQLPEERPGRRLPPLLASSPESPYRNHAGQPRSNSRKSVTVRRSEFTSGGRRSSFTIPIRASCRRQESCRNSQARLPPPASAAICGLRYSVSAIMPPDCNALRKLRELRSAGKEYSSGSGRTLSSIRYAHHAYPAASFCCLLPASATPGRHALYFDSRCSVSTVMPAVNQYTPLRFPRPCARSGGATLCSMYCLTAG